MKLNISEISPLKKTGPFGSYDFYTGLLIFIFLIIFVFFGWTRHYGFLTSINDLGHYDQAIWGIINRGYFLNTSLFNTPINKIGFHFDPILYLFAPLYCLKPSTNWLIIAQAVALSISAWPIYRLAVYYTKNSAAGFLWSFAYLANPFLLNAAAWDFHPLTLSVPFIAYAALSTERKRFYPFLISCFFILLCKEHFGLMVAGFGALWAVRHREVVRPLSIVCLGACHFILVFHYIMPFFSPTGSHIMLSNNLGQLSRYSWLGASVSEIVSTILKNPIFVLRVAFFHLEGVTYLYLLLMPFLGFSLLGISFLLPASGDLAATMLSANPMPRGFFAYHNVPIIPLFCAAALRGSQQTLKKFLFLSHNQLAGAVLIVTLILTGLPLPRAYNFWAPRNKVNFVDPSLIIVKNAIAQNASISAQANVGSHFSQREHLYAFPNRVGKVDTIILHLVSPTARLKPPSVEMTGTLASHIQMDPAEYLMQVSRLIQENDYGIALWNDPWLVMRKGAKDICSREQVQKRILDLKNQWLAK